MLATLTVQGPLDALAQIAAQIHQQYPNGVQAEVEPVEVDGWTVERAGLLLARLATKQRTALELVVRGNGHVNGETLRTGFGNDTGQVRGLTGPISKHVKNMIAESVLPEGTRPPTSTDYDPDIRSYQRTSGLTMHAELVPVFSAALELRDRLTVVAGRSLTTSTPIEETR